jgi:hypothetical protein
VSVESATAPRADHDAGQVHGYCSGRRIHVERSGPIGKGRLKYRPHRPQESDGERKSCKLPGYCTVSTQSVHKTAVGNRSSAGGTITAIIHAKVLQISTLRAVRSMQRILCGESFPSAVR